ncbi:cbb3-type cytochrome c oxidase N-terminal domain-containing protein [Flavihumibacter petaseus]|uniref:Cbb3-type cytochrome c oxidase subunit III n=1 Tax=Flavihumibacter petaseus NBRC 106054 TaxID=1220578 RepID=A0A0E9N5S9_9BACT|nr:cbb3-type cytochrome c oxidase N-terminal domain-containing protein [Flavihumibacter petaseus]GAO45174.1 cbb3-type cytochrome c oxidase subunit III [Flavihumibacter petaseus NBRC 106054]
MLSILSRNYKSLSCLLLAGVFPFLTVSAQPPVNEADELMSSPTAIILLILAAILLLVIVLLANLLLRLAQVKANDEEKESAQPRVLWTVAGLSTFAFTTLVSVIFLELIVILALLIQVRLLLKRSVPAHEAAPRKVFSFKKFFEKANSFRPIEEEKDIDMGHEYDGIRELDNRLPPWWLYGFYLTVIVSVIYLWRFHVSHSAPSSEEEYVHSVAVAEAEVKAYLAKKGEAVDENSVTVLTTPGDISAGKDIFIKSCVACHKADGGGSVGPNLTDEFWIHGGNVKSVFKTIRYGINAMPAWQNSYSNKQIAQVASYVKSLKGTNPPGGKEPQGEKEADENESNAGSTANQ